MTLNPDALSAAIDAANEASAAGLDDQKQLAEGIEAYLKYQRTNKFVEKEPGTQMPKAFKQNSDTADETRFHRSEDEQCQ
jgi:hypothetical protein